jgi:hypothetical protein
MSHRALEMVFAAQVGDADEKHTLTALAHHHNAKTGECYPSQETIAAETERSVDTIQRHLKSLEKKGLISRKRRYRNGYRTSDSYTLAMDGKLTPQSSGVSSEDITPQPSGVSSEELTPQGCGLSTPDLTPQNPDLTPQTDGPYTAKQPHLTPHCCGLQNEPKEPEGIEPEVENTAPSAPSAFKPDVLIVAGVVDPIDVEFQERFWPAYPDHVKKKDAKTAYSRARKKATADEIINGLEIYKRTKPKWQGWAHPTSWLNGERWKDQPAAPPHPQSVAKPNSTVQAANRIYERAYGSPATAKAA